MYIVENFKFTIHKKIDKPINHNFVGISYSRIQHVVESTNWVDLTTTEDKFTIHKKMINQ